jgi:hypothetical protein
LSLKAMRSFFHLLFRFSLGLNAIQSITVLC